MTAEEIRKLIKDILKGGKEKDKAIIIIFNHFRNEINHSRICDSEEDFMDCYQDTMIAFVEMGERLLTIRNVGGYIYRAVRYCCNRKRRSPEDQERNEEWQKEYQNTKPPYILSAEELKVVKEFEKLLGGRRIKIIYLSDAGWTMKEIAIELGYKNGDAVKTAKYKALTKGRKILKDNPELKAKIEDVWSLMK